MGFSGSLMVPGSFGWFECKHPKAIPVLPKYHMLLEAPCLLTSYWKTTFCCLFSMVDIVVVVVLFIDSEQTTDPEQTAEVACCV